MYTTTKAAQTGTVAAAVVAKSGERLLVPKNKARRPTSPLACFIHYPAKKKPCPQNQKY